MLKELTLHNFLDIYQNSTDFFKAKSMVSI